MSASFEANGLDGIVETAVGPVAQGAAARDGLRHDWAAGVIVPARYCDFRLDGAPDRSAAAAVRRWVESWSAWPGKNLVLVGQSGAGKTALATAALYEIVCEREMPPLTARFASVPDLLYRVESDDAERWGPKRSGAGGMVAEVRDAAVLVLDDLDIGAERLTTRGRHVLDLILAARYDRCLPTIATTSRDRAELEAELGVRVARRLFEDATVVYVHGPRAKTRATDAGGRNE